MTISYPICKRKISIRVYLNSIYWLPFEQGVSVSQEHDSPDFFIERAGLLCSVEAVTANLKEKRAQGLTTPTFAPKSRQERMIGSPAVRFAKTLRSKLQRQYEKLPVDRDGDHRSQALLARTFFVENANT